MHVNKRGAQDVAGGAGRCELRRPIRSDGGMTDEDTMDVPVLYEEIHDNPSEQSLCKGWDAVSVQGVGKKT